MTYKTINKIASHPNPVIAIIKSLAIFILLVALLELVGKLIY